MIERTAYYISIENKMIEKTKMPGQAELKIFATEEEFKKIDDYMSNKDTVNKGTEEVKGSPNDNPSASYTPSIGNDENYDNDFDKLIDLVYILGTDKTKESLEQFR